MTFGTNSVNLLQVMQWGSILKSSSKAWVALTLYYDALGQENKYLKWEVVSKLAIITSVVVMRISRAKSDTAFAFVCLVTSNWPPGHPRSDHHVSNPHRPDYYCIQAGREDPQCS